MIKLIISLLLSLNNVLSQPVQFNHNCNVNEGFTWCDTSNKCVRTQYEPCLPITKQCALCLVENYGQDIDCGKHCSIQTIQNMESAGFMGTDINGCSIQTETVWCSTLERCIKPTIENCPNINDIVVNCDNIICPISCMNGYKKNNNGCDICICSSSNEGTSCEPPNQECSYRRLLCPKITEVTQCSENGIDGYTTYQLSLVFNHDSDIYNIYALFGDSSQPQGSSSLIMPPAYQGNNIFNSNFGGISPQLIDLNIQSRYDSWLTIGIVDGDIDNRLSSISVDFNSWTTDTSLIVTDGAIFSLNPNEKIVNGNEYIIAQLTLPSHLTTTASVNVQGKFKNVDGTQNHESWTERDIIFHLSNNNNPGH